jgi:hypothetical protein
MPGVLRQGCLPGKRRKTPARIFSAGRGSLEDKEKAYQERLTPVEESARLMSLAKAKIEG